MRIQETSNFSHDFHEVHQPQVYVYLGKKQLFEVRHGSVLNIRFSGNKVLHGWPVLQSVTFSTVLRVTKIKQEYFVHPVCSPSKRTRTSAIFL
jgi:hypothetical protein